MTQPSQIGAQLSDMIPQSVTVLSKPSVNTFERFERRGGLTQAMVYVAVGAAIIGLLNIFSGGIGGLIGGVLSTLVGFAAFAFVAHAVGKSQGGTGSLDEVAYTFSLFWVPLQIAVAALTLVLFLLGFLTLGLGWLLIPLVGVLAIVASVYYGYLAVQSSMNLYGGGSKAWITLIAAGLASWVVTLIFNRLF